MKEFLKDLGNM